MSLRELYGREIGFPTVVLKRCQNSGGPGSDLVDLSQTPWEQLGFCCRVQAVARLAPLSLILLVPVYYCHSVATLSYSNFCRLSTNLSEDILYGIHKNIFPEKLLNPLVYLVTQFTRSKHNNSEFTPLLYLNMSAIPLSDLFPMEPADTRHAP